MRILAIESSCDETAAAVVEDGEQVLSSVVASQLATHGKYGGVVPELASREHLRAIVPVVRLAMEQAGTDWDGLAAIAVTEGPGLVGSLLVGVTYAKALCFARGIPLIGVNHVEGHIHAVVLEAKRAGHPVELPALALVVSGGHTHLFEVGERFEYKLLGKTRERCGGRGLRQGGEAAGLRLSGRPRGRQVGATWESESSAVHDPAHEGESARLQFQRAEDGGAALDAGARHMLGGEVDELAHALVPVHGGP